MQVEFFIQASLIDSTFGLFNLWKKIKGLGSLTVNKKSWGIFEVWNLNMIFFYDALMVEFQM